MLESVFAVELGVQLRYNILADQHRQRQWDLAEDKSHHSKILIGELHKAAGPQTYI
jgi:hypothetical protein